MNTMHRSSRSHFVFHVQINFLVCKSSFFYIKQDKETFLCSAQKTDMCSVIEFAPPGSSKLTPTNVVYSYLLRPKEREKKNSFEEIMFTIVRKNIVYSVNVLSKHNFFFKKLILYTVSRYSLNVA